MATEIKYNYGLTEDLNLSALLEAGGYPTEHLGDLALSDFTGEDADGYSSFKVTVPSLEHPVAELIGGEISMKHKFKRANFLKPGVTTNEKLFVTMQNFNPLEVLRARFSGNIASSVDFTKPLVHNPSIWDYIPTLTAPVNSKTFSGTAPIEVRTLIDASVAYANMTGGVITYNPYARVTEATNGKKIANSADYLTVPISGIGITIKDHYVVGEYDGNLKPEWNTPALVLYNALDKASTDPLVKGMVKRFEDEILDDSARGLEHGGMGGGDNQWMAWVRNYQWGGFPGVDVNKTLYNENTLLWGGVDYTKVANTEQMVNTGNGLKMIVMRPTIWVAVRDFLFKNTPVTIAVNRDRFGAERVIPAGSENIPADWLTQVGTFNQGSLTLAFDLTSRTRFETLTEYETNCIAAAKEMLTVGNYSPTITVKTSEEAGSDFNVKLLVRNPNSKGDRRYDSIWCGPNSDGTAGWEFTIEFLGKRTQASSIAEILPGYDGTPA